MIGSLRRRRGSVQAIDWFRLVWDMVQRGHTVVEIAEAIVARESTVRLYLAGAQPKHWRGELLLQMWCDVTGRRRDEAPTEPVRLSIRVVPARRQQAVREEA